MLIVALEHSDEYPAGAFIGLPPIKHFVIRGQSTRRSRRMIGRIRIGQDGEDGEESEDGQDIMGDAGPPIYAAI